MSPAFLTTWKMMTKDKEKLQERGGRNLMQNSNITEHQILHIKRIRWRLSKDIKIKDRSAALQFVDDLGFVTVVSDKVLPSFYALSGL